MLMVHTCWDSTHMQLRAICNLDATRLDELLCDSDQGHLVISPRQLAMLKEMVEMLEPTQKTVIKLHLE